MVEVMRNTCPKCGGPTRLATYTYEQSCASCNRIDQLEARVTELTEAAKAVVDDAELNGGGCGPFYGVNCKKLEALAALIPEKGECPHQFHYFGEQKTRRCVKCNKLEK